MSEQLSASQMAAQRRREKILGNSNNRLKLVTGQSEELERTPEPKPSPKNASNTSLKNNPSKSSVSRNISLRVYKWTWRVLLLALLSVLLMALLDLNHAFVKFVACFSTLEGLFLAVQWIHLRDFFGLKTYLEFLFRPAAQAGEIGQYVDLALMFFGLEGKRAELFRCIIVYGIQIACDFFLFTFFFVVVHSLLR
ncbi:uncharacterized protein LOC129585991 [Paramacrobiotus metropolitanus]|uniref:uncharacterized protein LOC129585991 n=1 Tax=Paramacrobiotus metropolitanus TaxID=2943436 RepID=UPI002445BCF9|nr:uncharacterized protein LOC129585991 [Paramacrobiotus metropolitanus]